MTTADLLAELRRLDVRVRLDGDRLRLDAPVGVLTDEQKRTLAQRKTEVVAFLREVQRLAAQQRAIVPLHAGGTRPPIFAVAGHNGDVFAYRALAQQLGAEQPFFGLQPPGLDDTGEPLTSVEDIAHYFAKQIRACHPDGPMTIAGYCAGGSIAFELARQLHDAGARVTNLILFGAPYCTFYRRWHSAMAVLGYCAGRAMVHARTLCALPAAERGGYLAQRLHHLAGHASRLRQDQDVTDPVLVRRGAVVAATLSAARAYVPKPCGIHIDFMLPCDSWQRSSARPLRWARFAASTASFVGPPDCTGDTMLLPGHVATFATLVAGAQQRHLRNGGT